MTISNKLLPTTVVGSYPAVKPKGLRLFGGKSDEALETAVADQIEAGVDIISSGQVRGDMISSLTSLLPGIKGSAVKGTIGKPLKPLTLADTQYAMSKTPKVKGILTGPTTLAHALKIETPLYRDRGELILDLAQAIATEAQALDEAGVAILQVDEPILSTGAADLNIAKQALDIIYSVVRSPTCLHVCGGLGGVIDEVLKVQVDIFDFEFACNPVNHEVLSVQDLKGRMLGYGVVDSANPEVESFDMVHKRVLRAVDEFGAERLLIDPDCGLRMHTRDGAFRKLSTMVAATTAVRQEL